MNEVEDEIREALSRASSAVARGWKRIMLFALVGLVLMAGLALVLPPNYVAHVLLLPMEQNSATSLRGIASSLAELYTGSAAGTDLTKALPDIVHSRAYLERLLATTVGASQGGGRRLLDIIAPSGSGEIRTARAVKQLGKRLEVGLDRRTGTISLRVRLEDPRTAAEVANAGAGLLQELINDLFTSQASQERRFLEERIADTQERLRKCEDQLGGFRERNVRVGGSPRLALEEARLMRAVREQEQVYLTLREQYELARISETRRIPSIRVVDPAVPPVERDWPPRRLFALTGLVFGAVVGMVVVVRGQRPSSSEAVTGSRSGA